LLFGNVTGLAIDAAGRVYVSNDGELRVSVFGGDGKSNANIGLKGKRPGAFEYPTYPVVAPDGALYVRSMSEMARFIADPKTACSLALTARFRGLQWRRGRQRSERSQTTDHQRDRSVAFFSTGRHVPGAPLESTIATRPVVL
jgi:DNA-binding beta-propeller fold protein YncE